MEIRPNTILDAPIFRPRRELLVLYVDEHPQMVVDSNAEIAAHESAVRKTGHSATYWTLSEAPQQANVLPLTLPNADDQPLAAAS